MRKRFKPNVNPPLYPTSMDFNKKRACVRQTPDGKEITFMFFTAGNDEGFSLKLPVWQADLLRDRLNRIFKDNERSKK